MSRTERKRKIPAWMTNPVQDGCSNVEPENQSTVNFSGLIKYCANVDDMGLACEELLSIADQNEEFPLGFDVEWPINFSQGSGKVALIQVCPNSNVCYLFHVSFMRALPSIFLQLIQHPNVKLVGSCIKNDIWKLSQDFNFLVTPLIRSGRVVDIRELANEVLQCEQTWSLDRLALHLLSLKVDKTDSVRKSRWDKELNSAQQLYAATDAYVSLLIYNSLKEKKQEV